MQNMTKSVRIRRIEASDNAQLALRCGYNLLLAITGMLHEAMLILAFTSTTCSAPTTQRSGLDVLGTE
jgi:hypothetical protein